MPSTLYLPYGGRGRGARTQAAANWTAGGAVQLSGGCADYWSSNFGGVNEVAPPNWKYPETPVRHLRVAAR